MDLAFAETYLRISTRGSDFPKHALPAADLLNRETMLELLTKYSGIVKGTGLELAVSFFGTAVYGLIAMKQRVMSLYGRILDLSLPNITVQLETLGEMGQYVLKLGEIRWTELPDEGRQQAVEAEWDRFFKEDMNPLIESAAAAGGFKPDLIWNQYGSTAAYTMDYARLTVPEGPELQRLQDDFELLCGLPGGTFNRKRNPFQYTPKFIDNPYQPGTPLMVRSACCMVYKREGGVKCYYCPILKTEERLKLREQIEAGGA